MKNLIFFLSCLLFFQEGFAHNPSTSFIQIKAENNLLSGTWDLALRDLELLIGIDSNHDGQVTWGELLQSKEQIFSLLDTNLTFSSGKNTCDKKFSELMVRENYDGMYAVANFMINCKQRAKSALVNYQLLFEHDAQHVALISVLGQEGAQSYVFSDQERKHEISFTNQGTTKKLFLDYVKMGIWHIWLGFDHLLFVLLLLLPSVLELKQKPYIPHKNFRSSFMEVFAIITSFTVAHSITLGLSAFGIITLKAVVVESAIALTIIFSAINNIHPIITRRIWIVTFGFGLIHGMGFASVLSGLGLPQGSEILALLSFNIGVEIGQLVFISVVLPIIFTAREKSFYQHFAIKTLSLLILALASIWLLQRLGLFY